MVQKPRSRVKQPPVAASPLEPPPERWKHGQEPEPGAPRRPIAVQRGVSVLLRAQLIGEAEERAATRFAEDYLAGIEGVRPSRSMLRAGTADAHDVAIARATAVARHRAVAQRLGPMLTAWLLAFVVDDLSFVAMAERYWPGEAGRREIKGAMVTLLALLSRIYALLDRLDRGGRRVSR